MSARLAPILGSAFARLHPGRADRMARAVSLVASTVLASMVLSVRVWELLHGSSAGPAERAGLTMDALSAELRQGSRGPPTPEARAIRVVGRRSLPLQY